MLIGFIRPTRRTTAARQVEDLTEAGAEVIEEDLAICHQHIRPGDTLLLWSLHLLAPDWATFHERMRQIAEHGGMVRTLDAEGDIDPATAARLEHVREAWQREKQCLDPAEMRRRGQKGGRQPALKPGSAAEKMALAYRKMDKTEAETLADLEAIHGVKISRTTLSRLCRKKLK